MHQWKDLAQSGRENIHLLQKSSVPSFPRSARSLASYIFAYRTSSSQSDIEALFTSSLNWRKVSQLWLPMLHLLDIHIHQIPIYILPFQYDA